MCGICGVINLRGEEVSPVLLRKMTDSISHRGPDGEGWYRDKNVGLGHRRLAILDLSPAGHQPMITRDGRFALTYNGEIYNHSEIRVELEALGHQFRSRTDSEVVLLAWAQWGTKCITRFNGMFAFAIWDSLCEEITLVRDRYGVKPLYYAAVSDSFVFGSEQRAVLEHPAVGRQMNMKALYEYFTFQNIFTDRTLNENIKILPAGHYLTISGRTGFSKSVRYWDFHFSEPSGNFDAREYEEELDRLLRQAVSRQLLSDVEIGSYLSGGMDSGTLTALASKELPYIKTFTCGFDLSSASGIELGFDERERAEAMSALFKTEHYEMVLKSGDMERAMSAVVQQLEEPRVGQSYPNFYVSRLASKFVKVVLSGAGGDELFGGYPWRYFPGTEETTFDEYVDKYYSYWHRLVSNTQLRKLFHPVKSRVEDVWTRDIFRDVFSNHENELKTPSDFVNHSLYFEAKTFLHGLLVVEDKLSMAHGLETRVPFLDNDLVDFAMRCPSSLKVRELARKDRINENEQGNKKALYYQKTNDGKQILRNVMSRHIPSSVTDATKKGFSSPDASWFKGESIEFVKRVLLSPSAKLNNIVDVGEKEAMLEDHFAGRENRRLLIWSLLSLEFLLINENFDM
jgi:asparagine synthase (glutamine-hydrolysing)